MHHMPHGHARIAYLHYSGPLSITNGEALKAMMCHAHFSVGAADRGKYAAAADADIIDVIVQVWQQSQLFRGCLAASLSTLQANA